MDKDAQPTTAAEQPAQEQKKEKLHTKQLTDGANKEGKNNTAVAADKKKKPGKPMKSDLPSKATPAPSSTAQHKHEHGEKQKQKQPGAAKAAKEKPQPKLAVASVSEKVSKKAAAAAPTLTQPAKKKAKHVAKSD
jgi:hypothetical protein